MPFQDGTCPSVPARPLESLTGQHIQICSPRMGWEPLSKVSTWGRCKHAQDWPISLGSNPFSHPPGLALGPCTDKFCLDPSPRSSLPPPALTEDFQPDFQALPVSCADSHSVGATVTFLDILQRERSIGWMENGLSCVGGVDGWGVSPAVVLQDGVGAAAIAEFPLHGIAVGDVVQPREQHGGSHRGRGSLLGRSRCLQSRRERPQQPWREEGAGGSPKSRCSEFPLGIALRSILPAIPGSCGCSGGPTWLRVRPCPSPRPAETPKFPRFFREFPKFRGIP